MKRLLLLFFVSTLFIVRVFAQNTYVGPSGGSWITASNWSLGTVPTSFTDVNIPANTTVNINFTTARCNTLSIAGGAMVRVNGSIASSTLSITGNVIGTGALQLNNSGNIAFLRIQGDYLNTGLLITNHDGAGVTVVRYEGMGNQRVKNANYYDLETIGAGVKSVTGTAPMSINRLYIYSNTTYNPRLNSILAANRVTSVTGYMSLLGTLSLDGGSAFGQRFSVYDQFISAAGATLDLFEAAKGAGADIIEFHNQLPGSLINLLSNERNIVRILGTNNNRNLFPSPNFPILEIDAPNSLLTASGPITATSVNLVNGRLSLGTNNTLTGMAQNLYVKDVFQTAANTVFATGPNANKKIWIEGNTSILGTLSLTGIGTRNYIIAKGVDNTVANVVTYGNATWEYSNMSLAQTIANIDYFDLILLSNNNNAKNLKGVTSIKNNLTVSGAIFTDNGHSFNKGVIGGNLYMDNGSFLAIFNSFNFINEFATFTLDPSTVIQYYSNTNVSISAKPIYENVAFYNGGTKTMEGLLRVNGNLSVFNFAGNELVLSTVAGTNYVNGNVNITRKLTYPANGARTLQVYGNFQANATTSHIDMSGGNFAHVLQLYGETNSAITSLSGINAEVSLARSGNQQFGKATPAYPRLRINGGGFKRPTGDIDVSSIFYLTNGYLELGNTNLIMGENAVFSGTPASTRLVLTTATGAIIKRFPAGANQAVNITFPLGHYDQSSTSLFNDNRLVMNTTLTAGVGGGNVTVRVVNGIHPNIVGVNGSPALKYWQLGSTNLSAISGTISGNYWANDLANTFIFYQGVWHNGTAWDITNGSWGPASLANKGFSSIANLNGSLTAAQPGSVNRQITVGVPAVANVCQGTNLLVPVTTSGTAFLPGNQYRVILHTLPGISATLTTLGVATLTSTFYNGNITVNTSNITPGVYRLTLYCTNPGYLANSISNAVTITGNPTNTTPTTPMCFDGSNTKSLVGANGTQWRVVPSTIGGIAGNVFTPISIIGTNTQVATVYNIVPGGCSSAGVSFTIYNKPPPLDNNAPVCINTVKPLTPAITMLPWVVTGQGSISGDNLNFVSSVAGVKTIVRQYNTCFSDPVSFVVNPNTAITTQPEDLTVGVGGAAEFSVGAVGAGLAYQWRRNAINPLTNGGIVSGATTANLTLSPVTLAENNSQIQVTVSGTCGAPQISNVVTLTVVTIPSGSFRSAVAAGNWDFAANWEIWNGAIWVSATRFPNQFVGGDEVLIQPGHTITHNINILNTLQNITVAGTLRATGGTLRTGGMVVNSTGRVENQLTAASYLIGIGGLINNGTVTSNMPTNFSIQNDIVLGTNSVFDVPAADGLMSITTRNQRIACDGCSVAHLPKVNIGGGYTWSVVGFNLTPLRLFSTLSGSNAASTFQLHNSEVQYYSTAMPMATGILDATRANTTFWYNANSPIKTGLLYNALHIYPPANTTFAGTLLARDLIMTGVTRLNFTDAVPSLLSVSGTANLSDNATVDMSRGSHAHQWFLSGTNTGGSSINLIGGQGMVTYNSMADQNVFGSIGYRDLHITNGSNKNMTAGVTAQNLSITGGATFTTNNFLLNGGTQLYMQNGTTLALGSPSNNTNIPFPTFSALILEPGSTTRYQSLGNQTVTEGVNYQNLVIAGGGTKQPGDEINVYGDFIINPGATYSTGTTGLNLYGNFVNNGTYTSTGNSTFFSGAGEQTIAGSSFTTFTFLDIGKLVKGNVTLQSDISIQNALSFVTVLGYNGGYLNLNGRNVTMAGNAMVYGANEDNNIITNGNYTGGSVFINGTTAAQYINKVIPFSGPDGYAPVTVVGLGGTFGANSLLELKYISTITGNSPRYGKPSLYARAHNITAPNNFRFLMPSLLNINDPKSVYQYNPTRTTVSGSYFDEANQVFGVAGNNAGVNATYVLEGEYFEPGLYRTIATGNWSNLANWERFTGINWQPATTLPGMALAGDQVLVNNAHSLSIDLPISHALQSLTIGGAGAQLVFGGTQRVLTVSGDFIGNGNVDMRNAAHRLYLGGATNSLTTLQTNGSGSTIIYTSTAGNQDVFANITYENVQIVGAGTKRLGVLPINGSATFGNVTIAPGATLYLDGSGGVNNFNGTTSILGFLTINNSARADFNGQVYIANTGVMNGFVPITPTKQFNFAGGILNYGSGLNFTGNPQSLTLVFGSTPQVIENYSVFNTAANLVDINTSVELRGTNPILLGRTRVNANSTVDNFTTAQVGTLVGLNATSSVWNNHTGSKLIYATPSAAYVQPMNGGILKADFDDNMVVYSVPGGTPIFKNTDYYNLSITGGTSLFTNAANFAILGDLSFGSGTLGCWAGNNSVTTIYGHVLGNGGLSWGDGINNRLLLMGNIQPTVVLNTNANNIIEYGASTPQNIWAGTYNGTVVLSGGGEKYMVGDVNLSFSNNGVLHMNGAVLNLGNRTLQALNILAPLVAHPFSSTNMIRCSGNNEGLVIINKPAFAALTGNVIPVGTGNDYTGITITGAGTWATGGAVDLQVRVHTSAGFSFDDYIQRTFYLKPSHTATDIQFRLGFAPADVVGTPHEVHVNRNQNPVLQGGVSLADNFFGVTATGFVMSTTSVNWEAYNFPTELYRSINSGNWTTPGIWEVSADNGLTFNPAIEYPGQQFTGDRVVVQSGHLIDVSANFPNELGNTTISGTLNSFVPLHLTNAANTNTTHVTPTGLIYSDFQGFFFNRLIVDNGGRVINDGSNTSNYVGEIVNNGLIYQSPDARIRLYATSILGTGDYQFMGGVTYYNPVQNYSQNITISGGSGLYANTVGHSWMQMPDSKLAYLSAVTAFAPSGTLIATATGNTFEYGGNSQQMVNTTYYNLSTWGTDKFFQGSGSNNLILNDFELNANFSSSSLATLTVLGNVLGSGDMGFSDGLPNVLAVGGQYLNTGSLFFDGLGDEVHYFGSQAQPIKPADYSRLRISGGGRKYLTANTTISINPVPTLFLQGAVLDIGNFNLRLSSTATINTVLPLGLTNMILTTGTGFVEVFAGTSFNLVNFPMVIGVANSVMPTSINANIISTGGSPTAIRIRARSGLPPNLLSSSLVWDKYWQVETQNVNETSSTRNIFFGYNPADLPAAETALRGSYYDGSAWTVPVALNALADAYQFTTAGILLSGNYAIGPRSAFAQGFIYRSVNPATWFNASTWEVSADGGATWVTATDYPGQNEAGDHVWVLHNVGWNTANTQLPIGNLTVTNGNLSIGANNVVIGGEALIGSGGVISSDVSNASILFASKVKLSADGRITSVNNPSFRYIFSNGIDYSDYNGTTNEAAEIRTPVLFNTHNQSIIGNGDPGKYLLFAHYPITIAGVTLDMQNYAGVAFTEAASALNGTNANSMFSVGETCSVLYRGNAPLMTNGSLQVSTVNTVFRYGAFTGSQAIYPTAYGNLSFESGSEKRITGSLSADFFSSNAGTTVFSGTGIDFRVWGSLFTDNASISLGNGNTWNIEADNIQVGTGFTLPPNSSTVRYTASGVQSVIGANYYNLELAGGGNKLQRSTLTVNGTMLMNGAVLKTSGNDVVLGNAAQIDEITPFSSTNYIDFNAPVGNIIKWSPNATGFSIAYPIGSNDVYAPVIINDMIALTSTPQLRLRTQAAAGALAQEYSTRVFPLSFTGVTNLDRIDATFFFDSPAELVGQPNRINLLQNNGGFTTLTGIVQTIPGNSFFNINVIDNIDLKGTVALANLGEGNLFRTTASGAWDNLSLWEISADNGVTFIPAVYLPGFGVGPDNVYIQNSHAITGITGSLAQPVKNLTIGGGAFLELYNMPITVNGMLEQYGRLDKQEYDASTVALLGGWRAYPGANTYFDTDAKLLIANGFTMDGANFYTNSGDIEAAQNPQWWVVNNMVIADLASKFIVNAPVTIAGNSELAIDNISIENGLLVNSGILYTGFIRDETSSPTSTYIQAANSVLNYGGANAPFANIANVSLHEVPNIVHYRQDFIAQNIYQGVYHTLSLSGLAKNLIGDATVLQQLQANSTTLSFSGAVLSRLTVNSLLGTANVDMSGGGLAHQLTISGDYVSTGSFIRGNGTVFYNGTSNQIIKSANYYNLELSGNSTKTQVTLGGLAVHNNLNLNGAVLDLAVDVLDLRPTATLTQGQPFGVNNMINCHANPSIGACLVRSGNAQADFDGFVFPIGNAGLYSPVAVNITTSSVSLGAAMLIKPLPNQTFTSSNFISRKFLVTTLGITATDFRPVFQFGSSEVTGTPTDVWLDKGNIFPTLIPQGVVDIANSNFAVQDANTEVNGIWGAYELEIPPALFRSINNGGWNVPSNWEISTNAGVTFAPAGYYPGQYVSGDRVSITGGNTINLNVNPRPIGSITVSGVFDVQSNNLTVNGLALVQTTGTLADNNPLGSCYFNGDLLMRGRADLANSHSYFRGSLIFDTDSSFLNMGNLTFAGLNRSITGTSTANSPTFGDITVEDNSHVVFVINTGWLSRMNNIIGLGTNSVFELGSMGYIEYGGGLKPMATGTLIASNINSQFSYSNNTISQNQFIKGGVYYNLGIGDSFADAIKYVDEDVVAESFALQGSKVVFSSITGISFLVNSRADAGYNPAEIDLSLQNQAHNLTFAGSFEISVNASIVGSNHPNSKVTYINTFNNGFEREILRGTYRNLEIKGALDRKLDGLTTVTNLSITGGATLDSREFQITGNAAGKMLMEPNTNLILGNPASTSAVAFPANFTRNNIDLQVGSTVTYTIAPSASGNQPVSSVPIYQNLITQGAGHVKTLTGNTTVLGHLIIESGHLDVGNTPGVELDVYGNTTINGVFQQDFTTLGSTVNFRSNVWVGNQLRVGAQSSQNIMVYGDLTIPSGGQLIYSDNATNGLSVSGNVSVAGSVVMGSGTNIPCVLNLSGANNYVENLVTGVNTNARVLYVRSGNQQVFASPNYQTLNISGGGIKSISGGNVTVSSQLNLNGAQLELGMNDLTLSPSAIIGGTFSNTNMILISTLPGAGHLSKASFSIDGFDGFVFPFGTTGIYSPTTITNINSIAAIIPPIYLSAKPVITTTGQSDFITRGVEFTSSPAIIPTSFEFVMSYAEPAERDGEPEQLSRYIGGTVETVGGFFLNTATGSFGINVLNSNSKLDGLYLAESSVVPTITGLLVPSGGLCAGSIYNFTYTGQGRFNAGNQFTIDISSVPFFTPFSEIGSLTSTAKNGEVSATIPGIFAAGNYYVRIRAGNPVREYVLPTPVQVLAVPQLSSVAPLLAFSNTSVTYVGNNLLGNVNFSVNGVNYQAVTNHTVATQIVSAAGISAANGLIGHIVVGNGCGTSTFTGSTFTFVGPNFASVTVTPPTTTISVVAGTQAFTGTILNVVSNTVAAPFNGLIWRVTPSDAASISGTGLFQAIDNGIITVTAISVLDTNVRGTATVNVTGQLVTRTSISPPLGSNYCTGEVVAITSTITALAAANYDVQLSDATGSFATPTTLFMHTNINTGVHVATVTLPGSIANGSQYRVRLFRAGFANFDNGSNLTIGQSPALLVAPISMQQTVCSGQATNITLNSTISGTSYSWTTPVVIGVSGNFVGSGSAISQTLNINIGLSAIVPYTVSASANGCSDTKVVTVTVQSLPTLNAVSSPSLCSGGSVAIPLTSPQAGTTFDWNIITLSGNVAGATAGSGNLISQALTGRGSFIYRIRPVLNGCSGTSADAQVTVFAQPDNSHQVNVVTPIVCTNATALITIVDSDAEMEYQAQLSGSPVGTPQAGNGGTLTLNIPTSALGVGGNTLTFLSVSPQCGFTSLTQTASVSVQTPPTLASQVSVQPEAVCAGDGYEVLVRNAQPGAFYDLYIDNVLSGSVTALGSNFSFAATTQITDPLTPKNIEVAAYSAACPAPQRLNERPTVVVSGVPVANVANGVPVCSGNAINIPLTGVPAATQFSWNIIANTGNTTGVAPGTGTSIVQTLTGIGEVTYQITPRLGSCLGNPYDLVVTVTSLPNTDLDVVTDTVCGNQPADITIVNPQSNVNYLAFINGNLAAESNFTNRISVPSSFLNIGSNTFSLQAAAPGCVAVDANNPAVVEVITPAQPPTIAALRDASIGCDNFAVTLSVPGGAYGYQWRRNGATIVDATQNTYFPVVDGSYTVDVFSTSKCSVRTLPNVLNITNTLVKPVVTSATVGANLVLQSSQAASYQWYVGRRAIVGATEQTYRPLYRAAYRVKTNVGDPCARFSDEFEVTNPSLELLLRHNFEQTDTTIHIVEKTLPENQLSVYPNPASDKLHLVWNASDKADNSVVIKLVNASGVLVNQTEAIKKNGMLDAELNLSHMATGIYKLIITDGQTTVSKNISVR